MNQTMNNIWNFEDQVIPRRAQILSKQVSLSFIDWDLSFQRSSLSFSPSLSPFSHLSLLHWIFNDFSFLRFTLPFQSFIIISLLSETWLSRDMDGMMIWYWMVCEEEKKMRVMTEPELMSFPLLSFFLLSFASFDSNVCSYFSLWVFLMIIGLDISRTYLRSTCLPLFLSLLPFSSSSSTLSSF